ncbi:MAG: glycosyltransferase family 4 protein [Desulfobacterales bacterium]|nr:glycosyltransferase family 4 protein [Desulfobacterales bacterium]
MKILHLISQAPDYTGSGKFIQQLIRQGAANGNENFLLAGVQTDFMMPDGLLHPDNCIFVRFDGPDLGFPIAGMSDVMPYPSTVFSSLDPSGLDSYIRVFKQKIRQAVDRFQPDILHTHHLWILSALVRQAAPDLPVVTTCHGTCLRQHQLCPHIFERILPDLKDLNRVIALSNEQKQRITATIPIPPNWVEVISGGYDETLFFHGTPPVNKRAELVYAGKLSSAKGLPWLLKSLKRLKHLPFRLHIAGSASGREKEVCLQMARDLGEKCVYHGMLSHSELGELMRKSHIFVLPSFYEGLPLVLMEALACGCRIVATALPGVKEIFDRHDSDLIHLLDLPALETIDQPYKKDEPGLESRLADLLGQVIDRVGKDGEPDRDAVARITRPYTWKKIYSRVETVYKTLLT